MTPPEVQIELDHEAFEPGERLTGRYAFDAQTADLARAVEIAAFWCSEGKGDEDRAIQHREERMAADSPLVDEQGTGTFSIALPSAPLSYDGVIVKLVWHVQVRAKLET